MPKFGEGYKSSSESPEDSGTIKSANNGTGEKRSKGVS